MDSAAMEHRGPPDLDTVILGKTPREGVLCAVARGTKTKPLALSWSFKEI
jgi:hypothetical protein